MVLERLEKMITPRVMSNRCVTAKITIVSAITISIRKVTALTMDLRLLSEYLILFLKPNNELINIFYELVKGFSGKQGTVCTFFIDRAADFPADFLLF
jgi:hypothetical protein